MRRNQSDLRSGREVEFVLRCPGIAINHLCGNCLAVVCGLFRLNGVSKILRMAELQLGRTSSLDLAAT